MMKSILIENLYNVSSDVTKHQRQKVINMKNLSENTKEQQNLTDDDIFTKMWTSPRTVFKYINDSNYDKHVAPLLMLSGISGAFHRASVENMGDQMSIWAILGICIIFGGLFGWISYYIYAVLISWTGKWLEGQGNTNSILRILSYAMVPSIVSLLILIPQIVIYGADIFKSDGDISSAGWVSNVLLFGSMALEIVLGVWTTIFCVIGISEVQKLSIGQSILNLLLPGIVLLSFILLIFIAF